MHGENDLADQLENLHTPCGHRLEHSPKKILNSEIRKNTFFNKTILFSQYLL